MSKGCLETPLFTTSAPPTTLLKISNAEISVWSAFWLLTLHSLLFILVKLFMVFMPLGERRILLTRNDDGFVQDDWIQNSNFYPLRLEKYSKFLPINTNTRRPIGLCDLNNVDDSVISVYFSVYICWTICIVWNTSIYLFWSAHLCVSNEFIYENHFGEVKISKIKEEFLLKLQQKVYKSLYGQ